MAVISSTRIRAGNAPRLKAPSSKRGNTTKPQKNKPVKSPTAKLNELIRSTEVNQIFKDFVLFYLQAGSFTRPNFRSLPAGETKKIYRAIFKHIKIDKDSTEAVSPQSERLMLKLLFATLELLSEQLNADDRKLLRANYTQKFSLALNIAKKDYYKTNRQLQGLAKLLGFLRESLLNSYTNYIHKTACVTDKTSHPDAFQAAFVGFAEGFDKLEIQHTASITEFCSYHAKDRARQNKSKSSSSGISPYYRRIIARISEVKAQLKHVNLDHSDKSAIQIYRRAEATRKALSEISSKKVDFSLALKYCLSQKEEEINKLTQGIKIPSEKSLAKILEIGRKTNRMHNEAKNGEKVNEEGPTEFDQNSILDKRKKSNPAEFIGLLKNIKNILIQKTTIPFWRIGRMLKIFRMRVQGLSYQKIGEILGLTEDAIEKTFRTGAEALRENRSLLYELQYK